MATLGNLSGCIPTKGVTHMDTLTFTTMNPHLIYNHIGTFIRHSITQDSCNGCYSDSFAHSASKYRLQLANHLAQI